MASKWDSLELDKAMAGELDLSTIMTRPTTKEEVALFCDKNFPHLHLANMADEAMSGEAMSMTQMQLPCGWYVYSYRRGDCYLLMMTSRYAGRNHAPLPPSAPLDMSPTLSDGMAEDATEGATEDATEASADRGPTPPSKDTDGSDDWVDDSDSGEGDGDGERELSWQAMSRLAAFEMIDFALEKGMDHAAVIGGTRYMIDSAYLAAKSHEDAFELSTDLSEADQKRLDKRVKHLMKTSGDSPKAKP